MKPQIFLLYLTISTLLFNLHAQTPAKIYDGLPRELRQNPDLREKGFPISTQNIVILDPLGPFYHDGFRSFNWVKVQSGEQQGWIPGDCLTPLPSGVAKWYDHTGNGFAYQHLILLKSGFFLFNQSILRQEPGPMDITRVSTAYGKWQRDGDWIILQWGEGPDSSWSFPHLTSLMKDLTPVNNRPLSWKFPKDARTIKLYGIICQEDPQYALN